MREDPLVLHAPEAPGIEAAVGEAHGAINKQEDGKLWVDACKVFVAQNPASGLVCPVLK